MEEGFLGDDPPWLDDLVRRESAKVARSFLITGNITDYAFDPACGYRPSVRLLVSRLLEAKDCVITYRLSKGISIHAATQEMAESVPKSLQDAGRIGFANNDAPLLTRVCQAFSAIRDWLLDPEIDTHFPRGVAFIFENVHLLVPAERGSVEHNFIIDSLLHWSVSPEYFRRSHCLILIAEGLEDVAGELRTRGGKIDQISIPRPSARTHSKGTQTS